MTRISLLSLLLVACSGDSSSDGDGKDDPTDAADTDVPGDTTPLIDTGFQGPWVTTDDNGDGTFTTTIAAISTADWVWFSFTDGQVAVQPTEPAGAWDLAFSREVVHTNGGDSGSGTVAVAALDRVDLDEIRWPPVAGWTADDSDDADGDGEPDWAMFTWFDYNYDTHTLHVADRSWVVRTPSGDVRLQYDDYYSVVDGNSGYPRFTWAWLTEPDNPLSGTPPALAVDLGAGPVTLHLRGAVALAPPSPSTSDGWDLTIDGQTATLNAAAGGLTAASVASPYDDVTAAPGTGFAGDLPGAFVEDPPGTWTPADLTWVVARPDGSHDKLRFDTTSDLRTEPL